VGTVLDSSGAAVKGATIVVKEVDRGTSLTTQTSASGEYHFPNVPVGNYEATVSQTGFETEHHAKFALELNHTARLDFHLKVGQASATVEVTAAAPILQTDTSQIGNILTGTTAAALPLPTANTNQLTLLSAPGVNSPNPFGFQAAQNTFGTGRPYVNGAREQENNFVLDGLDNNQPDNNDVAYVPSPDAIQEFNLITGSAAADFGNYLGGVINETIKSGTNAYHGSGWSYFRRGGWTANSFTNNLNGLPRPPLHFNNFGATFGGHIVKDKLFFFADFLGLQYQQPGTSVNFFSLPTAQLTGNFSALCTAGFTGGLCNNPAQQLFDPASSPANPAARTPFLNNQVPIRSPSAASLVSSPLFPSSPTGTVVNVQQFGTNSYQGDFKMDYFASEKDHLMGRYSEQGVTANTNNSILLLGNSNRTFPLYAFVLDHVHTFSPSVLNDARAGFTYFPVTEGFTNPTGQHLGTTFGIPGVTVGFLPALTFNPSAGLLAPGEQAPLNINNPIGNQDLVQSFHDTTWQVGDSVTWTHNRHEVHTGFAFYRYIMNDLYPGNAGLAGQFSFNGQFTGNSAAGSIGSAAADFLLGLPSNVQQGAGGAATKYLRNNTVGVFGQDNWRIRNNLTLNLGLRWEVFTPRTTNNGQDVNFNLITGVPQIGFGYNTYYGIGNWQPRLGFAWQPGMLRNSVVRAAYGISTYMEANGINNLPYQNPPFVQAHEASFITLPFPGSTLDQGFTNFPASACTAAALQAFSPACLTSATLHLTNPNLRPAMDQQWNFTIQHQLAKFTSISAGYVGNKIDHMSDIFIFNQNFLNPNGTVVPGPFAQPLLTCCGTGNSPTVRFNGSSGIQRYNALQIAVTQHEWKGLNFQANYTFSKCLSNGLGYFGQFGDEEANLVPGGNISQTNSTFFFQDAYNPRGNYGRCISDTASLFSGYFLYDLPYGKGRMYGASASPVANFFLGGWSIASDFILHTGFAVTATGSAAPAIGAGLPIGSLSPLANCPAGVPQGGSGAIVGAPGSRGLQFLNPVGAINNTIPNTFGTCGQGSFRGPGLTTSDFSVLKYFNFTERAKVRLEAQFLNLTNTPIFGAPSMSAGGSFGIVTTSYPGRMIQLGGKFLF
jgi:hypothetical protein